MLRFVLTAHTLESTLLGSLDIVPTGTGPPGEGPYRCTLLDADWHALRQVELEASLRTVGPWGLVRRALQALEPTASLGARGSPATPCHDESMQG